MLAKNLNCATMTLLPPHSQDAVKAASSPVLEHDIFLGSVQLAAWEHERECEIFYGDFVDFVGYVSFLLDCYGLLEFVLVEIEELVDIRFFFDQFGSALEANLSKTIPQVILISPILPIVPIVPFLPKPLLPELLQLINPIIKLLPNRYIIAEHLSILEIEVKLIPIPISVPIPIDIVFRIMIFMILFLVLIFAEV